MKVNNYKQILDSLNLMGVYVIREDDHRILYFNQKIKEIAPNARIGVPCDEIWTGSCTGCPLIGIGDKQQNHSFNYDGPNGRAVDLTAARVKWDDGIPAFAVTVSPHAESYNSTYSKIVRGNLTTNECEEVKMTKEERSLLPESSFTLTQALDTFAGGDLLYEEDRERFRKFSDIFRMSREFLSGKKTLICNYRRNTPEGMHWNTMEVVPDLDYTDDNQTIMIYVKDVQEIYREGLEHEEINLKYETISKAFGKMYFAIYAVNLETGNYMELVTLDIFRERIPKRGEHALLFEMVHDYYVTEDYQDGMREFLNMDTLQERLAEKNSVSHEFLGTTQGWCRASFVAEKRDADGRVLQFVYVTQEINQEKKLERARLEELNRAYREAETANKAKSDFLFKMSHDLRTPLNAIMGFDGLIAQSSEVTDKVRRYAERIRISGNLLLNLLNEILDMTKIESGNVVLNEVSFRLRDLIGELDMVISSQTADKRQTFTVRTKNLFCDKLYGDEARISRTLFNILGNAVKYTHEGGEISLSVSEERGNADSDVTVIFAVRDNGIGIAPGQQAHVFDEFIRGSGEEVGRIPGTGLGLSIAKSFTAMMGGEITLTSTPGEGSEFVVRIPLKAEEELLLPEEETEETFEILSGDSRFGDNVQETFDSCKEERATRADGACEAGKSDTAAETREDTLSGSIISGAHGTIAGLHILVVEDNELNREMISEFLELEGVFCETADGGAHAIEQFLASEPDYFDLIIMDICMPDLDGYETTRRIRTLHRKDAQTVPIVALTANAFAEDIENAKNAGMNAHLAKPLQMDKLIQTAEQLLSK